MLGLSKICLLAAVTAVAFLPGGRSQQPETVTCRGKSIQIFARIPCGPMGVAQDAITQSQCEDDFPNCCFDSSPGENVRCFSNLVSPNQTEAQAAVQGAVVAKPANVAPVTKVVESLPTLKVTGEVARSIQNQGRASARSFSSSLASLVFPECAVKTPFCYRTRCNPQVSNAETSPLACLSDPSCCFDRDLFVYRTLFGPAYMNGAPVCYYGPTSARYRQIAGLVQPYNPFFQTVIVDIFKQYFDTALSFQEQAICVITNAISLLAKQCGWDGITELECQLKGCCYNSNQGACYYPSSLSQSLLPTNLPAENYPELVAEYPGENVCRPTTAFSQNIYRRLPCRSPANSTTAYFTCRAISGCCQNPLALVPGLSSLSLGSSPNAAAILAATGGFGFGNPFGNLFGNPFAGISNPTQLISQFFCPYIFFPVPLPGFPDLTTSTVGCCTQQVCYHIKQGSPASWSEWSQWSGCSGVCGQRGQRSRARQCRNSGGQIANTCPGPSSETQACLAPPCCSYGPWRLSRPCNVPCGQRGSEQYVRDCFFPGTNQPCGTCSGPRTELRSCTGVCLARWSSWGNYGNCNAPCGSQGFRTRSRSCVTTSGQNSNNCPGSSVEQISCQGPPCCTYSTWSQYLPCNAPCGQSGFQQRSRTCVDQNGSPCNSCPGSSTEQISCQGPQGTYAAWSQYSPCNAPCGQSGFRERSRTCVDSNGSSCNTCPGPATETVACNGSPCYRSSWSSYGPCGVDCRRERRRYCVDSNNQAVSLSLCSDSSNPTERSSCSGDACLPFSLPAVSWSNWFNWGLCSVSCGDGKRYRDRICLYRGRINSPLEPQVCQCIYQQSDVFREEDDCNQQPCEFTPSYAWSDWSNWSFCSLSCGGGVETRTRVCRNLRTNSQASDSNCPGASEETRPCNQNTCTSQGLYSEWTLSECFCPSGIRVRWRCILTNGRRDCATELQQENAPCPCP